MAQVFVDAYVYKINDEICTKLIGTVGQRPVGTSATTGIKDLVSKTRLGLNNSLKQAGAEILMTEEAFDILAKQEIQNLNYLSYNPI